MSSPAGTTTRKRPDASVDTLFDKLGVVLKSLDSLVDDVLGKGPAGKKDADYREAWEELEEYLRTGKSRVQPEQEDRRGPGERSSPPSLVQDYANLELQLGASFENVRNSYKRLLKKYHPDRFANDPEKQKLATEITQKLNQSYQNIRSLQRPK